MNGTIRAIPIMTNYNSGEIVLVKFPFTNLEEDKKRPALVMHQILLSEREYLITVAMITSRVEGLEIDGDCSIADWEKSGLLHPSLVRLSKLATVDGALIQKKLGILSKNDFQKTKKSFQKIFKAWI